MARFLNEKIINTQIIGTSETDFRCIVIRTETREYTVFPPEGSSKFCVTVTKLNPQINVGEVIEKSLQK